MSIVKKQTYDNTYFFSDKGEKKKAFYVLKAWYEKK